MNFDFLNDTSNVIILNFIIYLTLVFNHQTQFSFIRLAALWACNDKALAFFPSLYSNFIEVSETLTVDLDLHQITGCKMGQRRPRHCFPVFGQSFHLNRNCFSVFFLPNRLLYIFPIKLNCHISHEIFLEAAKSQFLLPLRL